MRCGADFVKCIAGTAITTNHPGPILMPAFDDASLIASTYYLSSGAVHLAHAGCSFQCTDPLEGHFSSAAAHLHFDQPALLPSLCIELGGGATSITLPPSKTSQALWNLMSGETLLCLLHVCYLQTLLSLSVLWCAQSDSPRLCQCVCMLCCTCMSDVTGTSIALLG